MLVSPLRSRKRHALLPGSKSLRRQFKLGTPWHIEDKRLLIRNRSNANSMRFMEFSGSWMSLPDEHGHFNISLKIRVWLYDSSNEPQPLTKSGQADIAEMRWAVN